MKGSPSLSHASCKMQFTFKPIHSATDIDANQTLDRPLHIRTTPLPDPNHDTHDHFDQDPLACWSGRLDTREARRSAHDARRRLETRPMSSTVDRRGEPLNEIPSQKDSKNGDRRALFLKNINVTAFTAFKTGCSTPVTDGACDRRM